jgi:hypothetical protein
MGQLYHRKLLSGNRTTTLWAKYYVNGKPVREPTGTTDPQAARDFLKKREGKAAEGAPVPVRMDKVLYDELAADLRVYCQTAGKRDPEQGG